MSLNFDWSFTTNKVSASQVINDRVELRWEPYEGLGFPTVNIYRGSNPQNMQLLAARPGNTISYSDINPPRGVLYYQTEIIAPNVNWLKIFRLKIKALLSS